MPGRLRTAILTVAFEIVTPLCHAQASALTSGQDAISAADRITRLNILPHGTITAKRITVSNPFLPETTNGRPAWQIEIDHVTLQLPSLDKVAIDQFDRTFLITIDADSGQLLTVASSIEPKNTRLRPEPSAKFAAPQFQGSGEIGDGLPDVAPRISLLQALDAIHKAGFTPSPLLAREISARYVMEWTGGTAPRRVWSITLVGIPTPPPIGGEGKVQIPEWQRNKLRTVVDADSGEVLFSAQ